VFLISLTNFRWFSVFLNFFSCKAVSIVNVIYVHKVISDKIFTSIIVTVGKDMDRLCLNAQCAFTKLLQLGLRLISVIFSIRFCHCWQKGRNFHKTHLATLVTTPPAPLSDAHANSIIYLAVYHYLPTLSVSIVPPYYKLELSATIKRFWLVSCRVNFSSLSCCYSWFFRTGGNTFFQWVMTSTYRSASRGEYHWWECARSKRWPKP